MNTRTAEVRILLAEILKESLQNGIAPDFIEMTNSRDFKELGKSKTADPLQTGVALSSEVNDWIDAFENDSAILDEAASLQVVSLTRHRESFPARVGRLRRWFRKLAQRAQVLVMLTRTGTKSVYTLTESFSSLEGIDLDETTAYIDTDVGSAEINFSPMEYTEEAETGAANVRFVSATIKDGEDVVSIPINSNSLLHKHFCYTPKGVELTVVLSIHKMNDMYSGGRVYLRLENTETTEVLSVVGTSDEYNLEPIPYLKLDSYLVIPISRLYKDRTITMVFSKLSHDGQKILDSGNIQYQHIFSLQELRLPNRRYRTSGTVQTIEYSLPDALSIRGISAAKLRLFGTSPGDTRIDSYIAWGSGQFTSIEPDTIIPIGLAEAEQSFHPSGKLVREMPNPIYRLEGSTGEPVIESAILLEGYEQVEVESATYSTSAQQLEWWVTNETSTKVYKNVKGTGVYVGAGKSHKAFVQIQSNKATTITLSNIGVWSIESSSNVTEYTTLIFNGQFLNGKRQSDGTYEYLLPLIAGVNTLNLLAGVSEDEGGYINLGQLLTPSTEIFVKSRRATSTAAILSLDQTEKAYAVDKSTIFLNYSPPSGAQFIHRYVVPTKNLPSSVTMKFDLVGASGLSPIMTGYALEMTPGNTI